MENKNWIMGIWKFREKISVKDLGDVAKKWAQDDENYRQLYVRQVSKDQYGIGFTYHILEGSDPKAEMDKYHERVSDQLRRQFGNDLAGWDISPTVYVIK